MPSKRSHFAFFSLLLLVCGISQAGTNPQDKGEKVITIGEPIGVRRSGDAILSSPPTVTGLAFSHDGATLLVARNQSAAAAGKSAGPIEVWRLSPLQLLRTLGGPKEGVSHATLAPNGKIFAGLGRWRIQLWDWQTGRKTKDIDMDAFPKEKITPEESSNYAQVEDIFAFLPDGMILYTGMKHRRLIRLDTVTGQIQPTKLKFPSLSDVAIAADGKQICVSMYQDQGFSDGFILYDVKTASPVRTLPFATGDGFITVFFPNGKRLLNQGERNRAIDIATGKVLYSVPASRNYSPAAFSSDGKLLATGGDKAVYVWNANTGEKVAELPHQDFVTALAFAPDGHSLAVGFRDSTIKLWKWNGDRIGP